MMVALLILWLVVIHFDAVSSSSVNQNVSFSPSRLHSNLQFHLHVDTQQLQCFFTAPSILPPRNLLGSETQPPAPGAGVFIPTTQSQKMGEGGIELLKAEEDKHGGVVVNVEVEDPIEPLNFGSWLQASISNWSQQGKKGVWVKLPIKHSNLVDTAVKAGFRYHHAEPDHLMLVFWIPHSPDTLPQNASHRVGIGAFVINNNREMLVVQETGGRFKGTGIWKMPTGTVNEGEDICAAAIREVKEETGIETEFVEILAFRQSHKSFFQKSDMFFVSMLRPLSFDIHSQDSEIVASKWMPIEEYAAQSFVQEHDLFRFIAEICLSKLDGKYTGFSNLLTTTSSGKNTYLYFNGHDASNLVDSKNQQA
ncbi:nudix hydrolase 2-like isoform X1 [Arachis stenosperma]|uniref:nudix hydrolase 2-like isoform X1 n=1 Tax=Arachis stenosperma TaxID=217475 RepID=UPI0025ABA2AE|nr:nudix hydrolase 2-like isoform X1 [Arachis stenosperma]